MIALYAQQVFGTQVTVVSDARTIAAALPDARPTIWGAVRRVWEKLKAAIDFDAANEPDEVKRHGLQWGLSVAAKRAAALLVGEAVPDDLAAEWQIANEMVLSKLRENVASVSHPHDARLGTVGKLLPGLEAKIADDGEFLVRGPLVMKGYRKEPAKTADAIDADGWRYTGDILDMDSDGFLRIVDRKKELIINAAGKNMSPANIENTIMAACPMISAIVTIGDARPYNTALMVFDADSVSRYAAQHGLADASPAALAAAPEVIARIAAGVAEGNAKLSRVEQIKCFRVLPMLWEPGSDEMTTTMKLKRRPIMAKYAAEIEELYAIEPGPDVQVPKCAPAAQRV